MHRKSKSLIESMILGAMMIAFVLLSAPHDASAHGDLSKHKKQALVFIVDNIALSDLSDPSLVNIRGLMDKGSLGLMNIRSASPNFSDGSSYLTLGAGTKAAAGVRGNEGYLGSEIISRQFGSVTAKDEYFEKTGLKANDDDLIFIGIESIKARSAKVPLNITPGLLGQKLKEDDLSVALAGNFDTLSEVHREAGLIVMDINGKVPNAFLPDHLTANGTLEPDPTIDTSQYFKSDALLNYWDEVRNKNLVIVVLGETARVNLASSSYSPDVLIAERKLALRNADETIGKFLEEVTKIDPELKDHLIMLVSPNPSGAGVSQKNYLNPVLVAGEGFTGGTLQTPTTRRHGVITSTDFAPTILKYFNIEPPVGMSGRPFVMAKQTDTFGYLEALVQNSLPMKNTRNSVLGAVTTINIALVVIFLVYFFLYPAGPSGFMKYFPVIILVLMALPAAFLFQYPVTYGNIVFALSSSLALTLVIGISAYLVFKRNILSAIMAICALTWVVLAGDIIAGGNLMLLSYFGSDVISGGRFYGIGNTYMGIMVGATIVGLGCFWQTSSLSEKQRQYIALPILVLTAILIGHPVLGANVGGMISAVAGLLFFFILMVFKKVRLYHFFVLGVLIFMGLAALVSVDLYINSSQSHAGRAFLDIKQGGIGEVFEIIKRKWSLNMKFFSSSALSAILTLMMIFLIPLLSNPKGNLKKVVETNPDLTRSLIAGVYTAIVALLFNDTGIVAATAASQFIISPLLILLSKDMADEKA